MQQLNAHDQQVFISQLQSRLASLPITATNADVLTVVDMVERSDEIGIPKEQLIQSIASDEEAFLILFHAGSEAESSESLAFQIELYLNSWTLRVGTRATNGKDFMISFNDLTVLYADYTNLTVTLLVDSIFTTFNCLLSGQISLLTSKLASGGVYANEILITSSSPQKSLATAWFGKKTVKQPATTTVLKNTLLPTKYVIENDYILNQQKNGKPLFPGRTFEEADYSPLTYTDYKLYAPKKYLSKHTNSPRESLSVIFTAIVVLYLAIIITRIISPDSIWPVIVLFVLFVLIMGALAKRSPYTLLAGLVPLITGSAVFGIFVAFGMLAYENIPKLAEAVDGDNTALSMVLVLGWGVIGFVFGAIAFVKTEKRLLKLAVSSVDSDFHK